MSDSRRSVILSRVRDLVGSLMYYDRGEDEELPRGAIEAAVDAGEISYAEISETFAATLKSTMGETT